ncbi:hypothetical protein CA601_29490 [Paraburkholderia hospita]|nr:hypothetical protein CA601_29490 [Paraburkholderia hospita]
MKRLVSAAIACAVLVCAAAGCKKAHDAGNDSMNAGKSGISADGRSATLREAPAASGAPPGPAATGTRP